MSSTDSTPALQPFLRSRVCGLRATALADDVFQNSVEGLVLDRRLAWAARLTEFQRIEVWNQTRCVRLPCTLLYGDAGQVILPGLFAATSHPGDAIALSDFQWLAPESCATVEALLVRTQENRPIEIRRITGYRARIDPSYVPVPPRRQELLSVESICPR